MSSKKLFGKLNIVDIIIILVIIAAAAFFAVRYLNAGGITGDGTADINYTVVVDAIPEDLFNDIASTLPATMVSGNQEVQGTILSASCEPCTIESIKTNYAYGTEMEITIIPDKDQNFVKATFECTATIDASAVHNELGEQQLRMGRVHVLKSRNFEITGVITKISMQENS